MKQYDHVTLGKDSSGRTIVVNARTAAMLAEAEKRLGRHLNILQGSYNVGVAASAGTHDGGGVVDVWVPSLDADVVVKQLRMDGFAAWHRRPSQGPWGHHIHAVAIGDHQLAPLAAQQVVAYRKGFNGLGHLGMAGKDDGPKVRIRTWDLVRRIVKVRMAQRDLDAWRASHTATGEPK